LQVTGSIRLDAVGDITIANQIQAGNPGAWQDLVLYSATGAISQADQLADGRGAEALRAAHLDVHAATGILLFATELDSVTAVNSGPAGAIAISETMAGGDGRGEGRESTRL